MSNFAKNGKMRKRLIDILFLLVGCCSLCEAQQHTAGLPMPDFNKAFSILESTRQTYNLYNDSILKKRDHDDWVNFFRARSIKNHQLFLVNKEVLNTIHQYFAQPDSLIPDSAYHALASAYFKYHISAKYDLFIEEDIDKILINYFEKQEPSKQNPILLLKVFRASSLYNIYGISQMKDDLKNSYLLNDEVAQNQDPRYQYVIDAFLLSCSSLTSTIWLSSGYQTLGRYYDIIGAIKLYLNAQGKNFKDSKFKQRMITDVKEADERIIRNIYLKDSTILPKAKADSIIHVIIKRNMSNPNLKMASYLRTLIMKHWVHEITMKEALALAMKRYRIERKNFGKKNYSDAQLTEQLQQYVNIAYINDMAEVSEAKKRANARLFCEDIALVYKHRNDQQIASGYISRLVTIVTYDRLMKHLPEKERIGFLDELTISTQVSTYAHTLHVAELAKVMMEGILKYNPSLLVGTLGCNNTKQVIKHKAEFLDFIYHASLYHDLGKNQIISVVNNDYRPLTDHEFAIIKKHPEDGLKFLNIAPNLLAKYHDTTLGHHKWYNGKGGYPENFDNTKSPVKIMIDLVTFCDCMQAATERLGRNYKKEKTFGKLMEEFHEQAGTRINPDLVKLVDDNQDIADKLNNLVNDGWLNIYYNIYSQYFESESALDPPARLQ